MVWPRLRVNMDQGQGGLGSIMSDVMEKRKTFGSVLTVDGMSLTHLVDHMRMMLLFIVQERVNINKIIVK
jgi:hypothetical protein